MRHELVDIAAGTGLAAGGLTIGLALVAPLLFPRSGALSWLPVWSAAIIVLSLSRIGLCLGWRRLRKRNGLAAASIDPGRWETALAVLGFLGGSAWASLAFLIDRTDQWSVMLVGFVFTGALVLAGTSHATHRTALLAFAFPIVVAQMFNIQHLAFESTMVASLAWLALVTTFYFMPVVASASLRHGLIARFEYERRAHEQTAFLETAPLGILVVRERRIVVCNDAMLKILGYERKEQIVEQSVRQVMPDDEAWEQSMADARLASQGPMPPRIVRRRRADGTVIELMHHVATVRTDGGEAEHIGIYEDVQDRMAIEEGYKHVVRMQRLVFEVAGEGIAIVNDGVIEQANQALADLVGLPLGQLTARPLQSIFEDPHGWSEIERRFQRLGNTLKLERRVMRSDGRAIWANVTGCLVDAPADGITTAASPQTTTVKRSIWILADLSVQKRKEAENWHHANHDVMTGLPNRRFLQDRLDQALAFARRDGRRVAVVELDLDGFKSVNDTYGHRFGDAVLEEVARRLSTVLRELDTVGRWGGDEFVLVLKEIESREIVEETIKRVIARLSEPIVYLDQNLSIGASIGIALFPDHGDAAEALMLAADLAMYESKASGGNTWRFSSPVVLPPRGKYRPAANAARS